MTTFELLLKRYPPTECALFSEVSDNAGASRGRSIDFMMMNLWPSRGLSLTGIERKTHRSDWLREIKNPAKQESIFKYCDYFYLLTDGSVEVAKIEEIPATWGWMSVEKGKIVVKKDAPKLQPQPITRSFLAALLKRASSKDGYVHRDSIKAEIEMAQKLAREAAERQHERRQVYYKEMADKIMEFEKESGITFGRWPFNVKKVAAAIKYIAQGGLPDLVEDMKRARNSAAINLDNLDKTIQDLVWVQKEISESEVK